MYCRKENDLLKGINITTREVTTIVQAFHDAGKRSLNSTRLQEFISEAIHPITIICAKAQKEPYLYYAIREALANRAGSWMPQNMAYNSRIIYKTIATIWPELQADITRRFNIIRKDLRGLQNAPPPSIPIAPASRSQLFPLVQPAHAPSLPVSYSAYIPYISGHMPFTSMLQYRQKRKLCQLDMTSDFFPSPESHQHIYLIFSFHTTIFIRPNKRWDYKYQVWHQHGPTHSTNNVTTHTPD